MRNNGQMKCKASVNRLDRQNQMLEIPCEIASDHPRVSNDWSREEVEATDDLRIFLQSGNRYIIEFDRRTANPV